MAIHRPPSKRSHVRRLGTRIRQRLAEIVPIGLRLGGEHRPIPVRLQRGAVPQVRKLEPRLVLDASAALSELGQLTVTGTDAAEHVSLEIESNGDISLREGSLVVPIELDSGGMVDSVDPADVSEVRFDLGRGNDILDLHLPDGLDVTVVDDGGDDHANLRWNNPAPALDSSDLIRVHSETIRLLDSPASIVGLGNDQADFSGDLHVGFNSQLELRGGSLRLDGRMILSGAVEMVGNGVIDLSEASITAATAQTSLRVDLLPGTDSEFLLGGAEGSAGHLVENLVVDSADRVVIGSPSSSISNGPVALAGRLVVTAGAEANFLDSISLGDEFIVDASVIRVAGDVTTGGVTGGGMRLGGDVLVLIENDANLFVGDGSILIDGDGGAVDTTQSTLRSDVSGDAITIRNASSVLLGNVVAANGNVTLGIDQDIVAATVQAAGTSLTIDRLTASTDGSIDLSGADNQIRSVETVISGGEVVINDSDADLTVRAVDSRGGDVSIETVGSLFLGLIDAAAGNVDLTAQTVDDHADDAIVDLVASWLTITSTNGIGDWRPLETRVDRIISQVSDTGATRLSEEDAIVLESVATADGAISIDAGGTIVAMRVLSSGAVDQDISLLAAGPASDIEVQSIEAAGGSDVHLVAGDDVIAIGNSVPLVADDLRIEASNLTADRDAAIELATRVNDFQASVLGGNRGDIIIREADWIRLADSDQQDDEIVQTGNGQIRITAQNIAVVDNSTGDDGEDLKDDPEIVARGAENGRIDLRADNLITIGDDVQLQSAKETARYASPETRPMPKELGLTPQDRSIFLKSEAIVLGERIEFNTGPDQGVARLFSPRPLDPLPPVIDPVTGDPVSPPLPPDIIPAFFNPNSVVTNVLEQAVINDATGILTVDIGRPGERGLTMDIDWGAPNIDNEFGRPRRFQQINGLSADEAVYVGLDGIDPQIQSPPPGSPPLVRVAHFYSEDSILDSDVNDRLASTKPLEVRFSVRHHESILVEAESVRQGPLFGLDTDFGGIVSSTDNPTTPRDVLPGLENGVATFFIPSLTIPVAFIPVRDVIPEFETREVVVRQQPMIVLTQDTIESVESAGFVAISRREYFRIRVLSPQPGGDDLAPPEELPDDILSGDKLKQLLQELPDGRYELEYVLGDASERSILRVDVRDGKPVTPDEDLDQGILRLRQRIRDLEEKPRNQIPDQTRAQPEDLPPPTETNINREVRLEMPQESRVDLKKSSLPPVTAGLTFASLLHRRRAGRRRLSVAGRFSARHRVGNGDSTA